MILEPAWIEIHQVIALNRGAVSVTGESHAVLNTGSLESAVMAPRQLFFYDREGDVGVLACKLIVALCRAHAFEQGNKRTAWLSGVMFLNINGYDIQLNSREDNIFIAEQINNVITRQLTEAEFLSKLDPFIVPR
ncbi:type II toxin-antitoxin system death-on-curing family toxin [Rhizobium sp. AG855]|uniref:type II toxin-antitoxin system death-on-curing family toxin n=1 Tax=Rhizobium sp. AG855 TaxID=2183898 RepID=UPI000E74D9D2|nr:type II toxin-antitoxin system death-on-curing family toxin [Rhizobium sp. AG855]RKE85486.1 death-on-curing protein [Rhizobium sp. AG855]